MIQVLKTLAGVVLLLSKLGIAVSESSSNLLPSVDDLPARRLTVGVGNVGICYDPNHSTAYPLNGAGYNEANLRAAIDDDFAMMAKYVTHVRTYYSQYYGVNVAKYANAYGIKLDLGVYMTSDTWQADEISAAITAIKTYPDTIEAVLVGNENLMRVKASAIVAIVNQIKYGVGATVATKIKFGTVQRITEYASSAYDSETAILASNLDLLGVNIYPFFTGGYDANNPTALLTAQWTIVTNKFTASKVRLTETGFPTAGSIAASAQPSLEGAVNYYKALVNWSPPSGDASFPKYWFAGFDRRSDDYTFSHDYEYHFGFFTFDRQIKTSDFPSTTPSTVTTTATDSSHSGCVSSGAQCGNEATGAKCCPEGEYCQAWNPFYYQCIAAPVQCNTQQVGVDFYGNDLYAVYNLKPAGCCDLCAQTFRCKAYTFVNSNSDGHTACYLKSGIGTKNSVAGAVSAVVTYPLASSCPNAANGLCGSKAKGAGCCPSGYYCQPWDWQFYSCIPKPNKCRVQLPDVDFYGSDMGTVYGLSPSACCDKCAATSGCKGYTFVNDNPGATACYLKSSLAGKTVSVAAISGVVN